MSGSSWSPVTARTNNGGGGRSPAAESTLSSRWSPRPPRARLGDELELAAPAHARLAAHHVDDALDRAVVMGAGFRLGVDDDGAGPELLGAGARVGDGGGAVHARGLRGVDVELAGAHHA